jgi:hypothetical protein
MEIEQSSFPIWFAWTKPSLQIIDHQLFVHFLNTLLLESHSLQCLQVSVIFDTE